jgi:hypothetical protein
VTRGSSSSCGLWALKRARCSAFGGVVVNDKQSRQPTATFAQQGSDLLLGCLRRLLAAI